MKSFQLRRGGHQSHLPLPHFHQTFLPTAFREVREEVQIPAQELYRYREVNRRVLPILRSVPILPP